MLSVFKNLLTKSPNVDTVKEGGSDADAAIESDNLSQKRGLSPSDSPDGGRKKQHFNFDTDIEALLSPDGLEATPPTVYLPLLFRMLDVMNNKMDTLLCRNEALEKKVEDQAVRFDALEKRFVDQEAKHNALEQKVAEQAREIDAMKGINAKLSLQVDANEQHSRNECLVLHQIEESDGESAAQSLCKFVETVKSKTGVNLKESDIKRAHRLGSKWDGRSRPIIARFKQISMRNSVFCNKKNFKGEKNSAGKSISLTENLTRLKLNALGNARTKYGQFNAWTIEGRIYAMQNGNKSEVPITM